MRILVIEDEAGIARFLKDGLEEECFAVDLAQNGNEGLAMALANDYDLLVVDWMLPGISGIEVCRKFRQEHPAVPVLILTARDTIDDAVFGLEAGANDYIRKPFAFAELLARIRTHLRRGGYEQNVLEAQGLSMDPSAHKVLCNDREVELTPKEFSLLDFLLRHKGRVCSRSMIIEHVWDIHFDSDTSVIDVYVNYLRKKLNDAGCTGIVRTIRGVGYTISD
jgi:two-component system, OmpR family, copper resistance phosphate regulon response regulator CusR